MSWQKPPVALARRRLGLHMFCWDVYIYIYIHIQIYIYIYIHVDRDIDEHTCTYSFIRTYIDISVYICNDIYTHIYISRTYAYIM